MLSVLLLAQLSATSFMSAKHIGLRSSLQSSLIFEGSVDTFPISSSSMVRTIRACLRQREGRIAPDYQFKRLEAVFSCENLRLRGGSIALNQDEELEEADRALRSISSLKSDERSGVLHAEDDEIDENDLHPTPFFGYAELQSQLHHQEFRNGICIRTAQITDIMDMQRINLVCLPENYQVGSAC